MADDQDRDNNPSGGVDVTTASTSPEDQFGPRPLKGKRLSDLEKETITVFLRRGYSLPQGTNEPPMEGPTTTALPLYRAVAHAQKFDQISDIKDRWSEIQRERAIRQSILDMGE